MTDARYCTLNRTHEPKRLIDVIPAKTRDVHLAHCASPTCTWCMACYVVTTKTKPAAP